MMKMVRLVVLKPWDSGDHGGASFRETYFVQFGPSLSCQLSSARRSVSPVRSKGATLFTKDRNLLE